MCGVMLAPATNKGTVPDRFVLRQAGTSVDPKMKEKYGNYRETCVFKSIKSEGLTLE